MPFTLEVRLPHSNKCVNQVSPRNEAGHGISQGEGYKDMQFIEWHTFIGIKNLFVSTLRMLERIYAYFDCRASLGASTFRRPTSCSRRKSYRLLTGNFLISDASGCLSESPSAAQIQQKDWHAAKAALNAAYDWTAQGITFHIHKNVIKGPGRMQYGMDIAFPRSYRS